VGGPEQPAYLNAVLIGDTTLEPPELLRRLHEIEADHGRTREVRWGARTLDLDLIQVGRPGAPSEIRTDGSALTLPHPRAHERGFVLVPWAQIDPGATARVGDHVRRVAELAAEVDPSGVRPGPDWSPEW
jgi:dihydroneopterin aldolase/2-amino-4-hydroxy-6-hydroxymethyldihydropteridine diphosphokinase